MKFAVATLLVIQVSAAADALTGDLKKCADEAPLCDDGLVCCNSGASPDTDTYTVEAMTKMCFKGGEDDMEFTLAETDEDGADETKVTLSGCQAMDGAAVTKTGFAAAALAAAYFMA